ncbi:MAG TPA: Spy/CpxP family protein refolding chaperone [Vicinamibacterales bacterium]|nr:Spy/CpxP family protein refolding chaperone [Vicinamibacterales bacterium]
MDPGLRAELGITDQQSAALEQVWQRTFAQRMELNERLEKADAILQKMLLDGAPDEAAVVAQLDKVEAARSEANKARVILLYRMNKLLTQEQRAKLDAMRAMRERDGRRGGGPR